MSNDTSNLHTEEVPLKYLLLEFEVGEEGDDEFSINARAEGMSPLLDENGDIDIKKLSQFLIELGASLQE